MKVFNTLEVSAVIVDMAVIEKLNSHQLREIVKEQTNASNTQIYNKINYRWKS